MYVGHCCLCDFIPFCNVCFAGRSVCCIVYEEMEYLKEILVFYACHVVFGFLFQCCCELCYGICRSDRIGGEIDKLCYTQFSGEDSGYSILKVTFVSVWAAFLIKMCPVKTDLFLTLYIIGVVILNSFGNLVVEFARVYEIFNVFGIIYMARIWSMKRIGLQLYLYRIVLFSLLIY